mgnify:CR=1 FL=1
MFFKPKITTAGESASELNKKRNDKILEKIKKENWPKSVIIKTEPGVTPTTA